MEKAMRDPKKRFGAGVAANMSSSYDDDSRDFATKYSVAVYLTQPFEGETHYKSTFKVPPSDSYHEMHSAGVPSGPGRDVKPTRSSFPFDGSSHTHQAFPLHRQTRISRYTKKLAAMTCHALLLRPSTFPLRASLTTRTPTYSTLPHHRRTTITTLLLVPLQAVG